TAVHVKPYGKLIRGWHTKSCNNPRLEQNTKSTLLLALVAIKNGNPPPSLLPRSGVGFCWWPPPLGLARSQIPLRAPPSSLNLIKLAAPPRLEQITHALLLKEGVWL